ncbi:MAG: nucleoside deaminase [Bacteroidales bacterium]
MNEKFMFEAIRLSEESIERGGGPFGAVVVKNGKMIAGASNSVTNDMDPTAHAEVNAIRKACKILGTYDLSGCEIYSSCEPCPMCLSAIYWAHIETVYFGNTREDAKTAGFADDFIYNEFGLDMNRRKVKLIPLLRNKSLAAFDLWNKSENKTGY